MLYSKDKLNETFKEAERIHKDMKEDLNIKFDQVENVIFNIGTCNSFAQGDLESVKDDSESSIKD